MQPRPAQPVMVSCASATLGLFGFCGGDVGVQDALINPMTMNEKARFENIGPFFRFRVDTYLQRIFTSPGVVATRERTILEMQSPPIKHCSSVCYFRPFDN